jgi:ElaB/YqjD/DUF883 family membrane-anchored ribosome-binding protein
MICPRCNAEYQTTAMGELPWRRTADDIMRSLRTDGLSWDDVRRISDNLSRMITREMIAEAAQEEEATLRAKTDARLQEMRRATPEVQP